MEEDKKGKVMKKLVIVFPLLTLFLTGHMEFGLSQAAAEVELTGIRQPRMESLKKHIFELRPEISYTVYKEPGFKERGIMYGIVGSYAYHNKLMLKVEGKGSWGHVDYLNSAEINNIGDYMVEFRSLGGYDFSIFKGLIVTPYTGIGYRYLNDGMHKKYSRGYERELNYIYSPIGIALITNFKNNWAIGEIIEYDYFWWGKQKSHLSDVDPGYDDISNHQRKGYGSRVSITLQKKGKKVDFEIGPSIKHWNIRKSEIETLTYYGSSAGSFWGPKNNTIEVGIMGAVKF
jgi:hypothetical protein